MIYCVDFSRVGLTLNAFIYTRHTGGYKEESNCPHINLQKKILQKNTSTPLHVKAMGLLFLKCY